MAASKPRADPDIAELIERLLAHKGDPLGKVERILRAASDMLSDPPKAAVAPDAQVGRGLLETFGLVLTLALDHPEKLADQLASFATLTLDILRQKADPPPEPSPRDRRFRDPLWQESPVLRGLMQVYLAWHQHMQGWLDAHDLAPTDKLRVQFVLDQVVAAFSPSNLPLHPAALKRAESTGGQSAVAGLKNFFGDVQHNRGMPRQIRPDAYRLGETLATTPGAVVFRNDLLELIQYAPQTTKVHRRPVFLVPPQINKYYAFDLKPANSLLGFLVKQGFQVFTISWRNPDATAAAWGMEAYISAILAAIGAARAITGSDSVNLISACAGGLTAMAMLGYLAEQGDRQIQSHSLFVTALFPGNGSIAEAFTTAENLDLARRISQAEGTMDGMDLAHIFVWLRPDDLVWSFWINNNLMGRQPPPLDVLYWDNDSTRIPAQLHADFIDIVLRDVFRHPGSHRLFGQPINYDHVRIPTYFVAGIEDYLMPWRGVYRSVHRFGGQNRFILSTSGHVQSILRPPNLANTEYYVNDALPRDPEAWLLHADRRSGTWWHDWAGWLRGHAGPEQNATPPGNAAYPLICPAPGTYVLDRIIPVGMAQ
jgi:polyhydroxyalkanoate synthase subunit PhaC